MSRPRTQEPHRAQRWRKLAGLQDCGAVGQGSTFSPELGGSEAWGKLAHGKQSPDQDWHPKTKESRGTPSGMGWICAFKEELPVRNLVRTFRFDVLSLAVAEDKPLPGMTACAQPLGACPL